MANPKEIKFWDGSSQSEFILTIDEFTNQDWENLNGDKLMSRLPIGIDARTVVNLLVQQIALLSKRTRQLEETLVEKVLLEDKHGS